MDERIGRQRERIKDIEKFAELTRTECSDRWPVQEGELEMAERVEHGSTDILFVAWKVLDASNIACRLGYRMKDIPEGVTYRPVMWEDEWSIISPREMGDKMLTIALKLGKLMDDQDQELSAMTKLREAILGGIPGAAQVGEITLAGKEAEEFAKLLFGMRSDKGIVN